MPGKKLSKAEETRIYETLKAIESLGGSEAYKNNPKAFDAVIPEDQKKEIDNEARKQDALAEIDKFAARSQESNRTLDDKAVSALKAKVSKYVDEHKITIVQKNFTVLRAAERLGGSEGFRKYLDKVHAGTEATTFNKTTTYMWETDFAYGEVWGEWLCITYLDQWGDIPGSGAAWGINDDGDGYYDGWLDHAPVEVLRSKTNEFDLYCMAQDVGFIDAVFYIDGSLVAWLYGVLWGEIFAWGDGYFDWY